MLVVAAAVAAVACVVVGPAVALVPVPSLRLVLEGRLVADSASAVVASLRTQSGSFGLCQGSCRPPDGYCLSC